MRDPARIPRVLEKIGQLWRRYPDLRFCQLHAVIEAVMVERGLPVRTVTDAEHFSAFDAFAVEDDAFEAVLDDLLARGFGS